MKYTLNNLRFPVSREYDLRREIAAKLGLSASAWSLAGILRRAVDTRKQDQPYYDFSVLLEFDSPPPVHRDLLACAEPLSEPINPILCRDPRPYIVGMGPAALFCALGMAQNGLKPLLFDRGDKLEERAAMVERFWRAGQLDEDSNVQFGEGGAGAWSDGKLTSRSKDPAVRAVYGLMTGFGAPEGIEYEALPHLGTDGIRALVARIRAFLIEAGCEFHYRHTLRDIHLEAGRAAGIVINAERHSPEHVVLAPGNAARDTFRMLRRRGVALEPKPFALGFRIEQSQAAIDRAVYGSDKWAPLLGPASYRLTDRDTGSYTFCMCPGGVVVAASSEAGGIVTNGMSWAARNGERCNSAIVTAVGAKDYGTGLFDGMDLQRQIEQRAGQSGYFAPAQSASSFIRGVFKSGPVEGTYLPGLRCCDISTLFPQEVSQKLKSALQKFDRIIHAFSHQALLIAPETRTSSPIRILRDREGAQSVSAANLFPIGEGSGYAGGIVSSAADGYRLGQRFRLS